MTTSVVGVAASASLVEAARNIPVCEDGHLVGVLSLGDLATERDPESALADISAAPPDH